VRWRWPGCGWATPALSDWALLALESNYPPVPVASLPPAPALVVLGGGMSGPMRGEVLPNLTEAADRVWHAARVYHAQKAPLLVLSGGAAHNTAVEPEAVAMRQFLLDLGVPEAALLLESRSANTRQNAIESAALLKQRGVSTVILVTSAAHMPRARADFEAAGLEVVPAATDHHPMGPTSTMRWLPSAEALDISSQVIKEWVGLWALGAARRFLG
jgi:uncharacterized SAM-binding protein YcdF (DUF218 family)